MEEQKNREHSTAVAAGQIPRNLIRRPRDTVSSLLGKTAQQNQFKLDALTSEVFEPLEALLSGKTYLLSNDRATSLDCLALGFLSLALIPDLPYPWLRESMQAKAPGLARYTEGMRQRCFGGSVELSDVFSDEKKITQTQSKLPWRAPERATFSKIGSTLLNTLADATPILKNVRMNNRLREVAEAPDSGLSGIESKAVSEYAQASKRDLYVSIASVAVGVAALVGYVFHIGLLSVVNVEEGEGGEGEEGEGEGEGEEGYNAPMEEGEAVQVEDFLDLKNLQL